MTKLIAFINPEKFKNLFTETEILKPIGYTKEVNGPGGNKEEYLGNNDILSISATTVSVIDIKDIAKSKQIIFLIPDSKIKQVTGLKFQNKILYHSDTKRNHEVELNRLKSTSFGFKFSVEEKDTIYGDLVTAIEIIYSKKEADLNSIISKIRTIDPIQEAKIKLKNEILKGIIPKELDEELKDFQSALDDFTKFKDEHFLSTEYTNAFSKFLSDLKMEE